MCFSRQFLGTPSARHSLEPMSFGHGNHINHLILFENAANFHRLLKHALAKVHFLSHGPSIDLNFHQVRFLLLEGGFADLSVSQDADNGAVFLDSLEFTVDRCSVFGVFLCIFGKSLLLRLVPILVESTLELVAEMLSPHRGERSQAAWRFNVTNDTDDDHLHMLFSDVSDLMREVHSYGRSFDNGDRFHNFFLVHFRAGSVEISDNGGHTGFVSHGSCEMDGFLRIVLGKALDL